ncbi:MAG: hypothetical protein EZS28_000030 [Streblomastix strix]|uniref:Uncharacterized protein n=1 Tax=Streblomastix strix TaxID=222440 RepID=A0A5J4XBA7_9EUKA|nr:MAG: hypothetical protein EZS28_000030 [Streblomastix strix]
MSNKPSTYNVEDSINGLGLDILLEVVREMMNVRDIQNFVVISKSILKIITHPRFSWAIEQVTKSHMGTKALIFERMTSFAEILRPSNLANPEIQVNAALFEICPQQEDQDPENLVIRSMCVLQKEIQIDQQNNFTASCVICIDGHGHLKWFSKLELPTNQQNEDVIFLRVKSQGQMCMALALSGELWTLGIGEFGQANNDQMFKVHPSFVYNNGQVESSLGPSRIRQFCFDDLRIVVTLEIGAVFMLGSVADFQSYDVTLSVDGFIEITDRSKFKPRFITEIRGILPDQSGPYGIFGKHKPITYFRRMHAFLTDIGVVIARCYAIVEEKNQFFYTPIDPNFFKSDVQHPSTVTFEDEDSSNQLDQLSITNQHKSSRMETIVSMDSHELDAFITSQGVVHITDGARSLPEFYFSLLHPLHKFQLPILSTAFNRLFLTEQTHTTVLCRDGRFISILFIGSKKNDPKSKKKKKGSALIFDGSHLAKDPVVEGPFTYTALDVSENLSSLVSNAKVQSVFRSSKALFAKNIGQCGVPYTVIYE